jgi:hypothetical protein
VPSQGPDACRKESYSLSSEMTRLEYLTDAPHTCGADDGNVMAFVEAIATIGGRDAAEEFFPCGVSPFSNNWDISVELHFQKLLYQCRR